ncbi:MAG TPA: PilZ domain-containing protein [Kofleriaceae bacterium]|nr:PilZ domain-containing protein [Kofleriaceae bacterium]
MGIERRRWKRLRTELRLQLRVTDGEQAGRVVTAIGSHLNPAGIFVQLADPPPMGSRVQVTLAAEGTDGVLTAEGEVVDRVVLDQTSERPPGVGISLEQTGPAWQKLYHWLSESAE